MRYILSNILLLIALGTISCDSPVSPTTKLSQARKWFSGKWNLTAVSVMVSNPTVPNVQLIVNNNQITVIQDGKQTDHVNFEIVQTANELRLKTNAQPREDNWYVRDPVLQLFKNKMILDTGMATDLPRFEFERIN